MFGLYIDVLKILQKSLNFSTQLYLKEERGFGHKLPNGTWRGLLANVWGKTPDVDMVAASVALSLQRFEVADYLHPVGTETLALYVSSEEQGRREWLAFLYPLTEEVWWYLLLNAFMLLASMKILTAHNHGRTGVKFSQKPVGYLLDLVGDFWMLGASYFGRLPLQNYSAQSSIRVLLLFAFLSGNIVFMSYRASLTAELSVQRKSPPFDTLDEVMKSDYT